MNDDLCFYEGDKREVNDDLCFYEGDKREVNYDLWDQTDSASWPEKEGAGNLDVGWARVGVLACFILYWRGFHR